MVKSLDAIPWKKRQWGHTLARTMINTKQKLGLGLNVNQICYGQIKVLSLSVNISKIF